MGTASHIYIWSVTAYCVFAAKSPPIGPDAAAPYRLPHRAAQNNDTNIQNEITS